MSRASLATGEPRRAARVAGTVVAFVVLIVFLAPLWSVIVTSLSSANDTTTYPPKLWPTDPQFSNYLTIFVDYPFLRWLLNSLVLCTTVVVAQVITSSMAGFVFAKLRFPGRDGYFFLYMATMMIPSQVLIIPIFVIVQSMGLVNSLWGLIIPSMAGAFGTFFFRQFYLNVPDSFIESARLDGASSLQIYWSIFLPISRAPIATFATISFLGAWNSFLWPLILLRDPDNYPVTLGLSWLQGSDQQVVQWQLIGAASVVSAIPLLLLFIFAQQHLVRGLVLGSVGNK